VGNPVEEAGETATHLALDGAGAHDKLEVVRAHAGRHVDERIVHRAPETSLVEHPLELLRGRVDSLLDDTLDSLSEAVTSLERGGHRHQHVGELLVEGLQPLAGLVGSEHVRDTRALDETERHEPDLLRDRGVDEGEEEAEAEHDVGVFGGPQREIRPLENAVESLPLPEVSENALCCPEESGESGKATLLALALEHLVFGGGDVRIESPAKPCPAWRSEQERRRDEREQADDTGQDREAPV